MTDTREKLIELLGADTCKHDCCEDCEYGENRNACIDFLKESMADHLLSNGVTVREDLTETEKAMERIGRFGKLFMDYQGCPRGRVGRAGGISIYEEATMWGSIVDVDGNRWIPVLEEVLNDIISMAKGVTVQEWIPAREPPKKGGEYLCRCIVNDMDDMPFYMVLRYYIVDENPHFQHETMGGMKVTHWKPFERLEKLEPPKGD